MICFIKGRATDNIGPLTEDFRAERMPGMNPHQQENLVASKSLVLSAMPLTSWMTQTRKMVRGTHFFLRGYESATLHFPDEVSRLIDREVIISRAAFEGFWVRKQLLASNGMRL